MSNKCAKCEKSVYPMEQVIYDGVYYHKSGCFKCKQCNCTLGLSSVAKIAGDLYCKPCFKKIFKEKGNYASFGAHTLAQNAPMKDLFAAGVASPTPSDSSSQPTSPVPTSSPTASSHIPAPTPVESAPVKETPAQKQPVESTPETVASLAVVAPKEEKPVEKKTEEAAPEAEDAHAEAAEEGDVVSPLVVETSSEIETTRSPYTPNTQAARIAAGMGSPVVETSDFEIPTRPSVGRSASISLGGTTKKCGKCEKTVYPLEEIIYDGVSYHKGSCFKCKACNCTMGLTSVAKIAGDLYCKPCFKKTFKEKGTYASFGAHTLAQNAPMKDKLAAGVAEN